MKTLLAFFAFAMFAFSKTDAQIVCPVKFPAGADVKVYVTPDSTSADLIAYETHDTASVGSNNGVWYFGSYTGTGTKKVYFIQTDSIEDFSVYFTSNPANAGWINTGKSSLMN
jgi:hypothetical protein